MIRKATPGDVDAIVELAVESVMNDPIPVRIDRDRMRDMAREVISSPASFCWVSEIGGKVVGAVGALTSAGFWFERQQCDVLLFYCRAGGDGGLLIRRFANWVKSRRCRATSAGLDSTDMHAPPLTMRPPR
jgi:hypothetical protein